MIWVVVVVDVIKMEGILIKHFLKTVENNKIKGRNTGKSKIKAENNELGNKREKQK